NWESLYERYGKHVGLYPLHYYSGHLREMKAFKQLQELAANDDFIRLQIEMTASYEASFSLIQAYRDLALEQQSQDDIVQSLIYMLDLHKQLDEKQAEIFQRDRANLLENWQQTFQQIHFLNEKDQVAILFSHLVEAINEKDRDMLEDMITNIEDNILE